MAVQAVAEVLGALRGLPKVFCRLTLISLSGAGNRRHYSFFRSSAAAFLKSLCSCIALRAN
jgi:hypothetical protein